MDEKTVTLTGLEPDTAYMVTIDPFALTEVTETRFGHMRNPFTNRSVLTMGRVRPDTEQRCGLVTRGRL